VESLAPETKEPGFLSSNRSSAMIMIVFLSVEKSTENLKHILLLFCNYSR
jgi:hypothetical protein